LQLLAFGLNRQPLFLEDPQLLLMLPVEFVRRGLLILLKLFALGVEPLPGSSDKIKAMMTEAMASWERITKLTKIDPQ